jgi:hypothetical protein
MVEYETFDEVLAYGSSSIPRHFLLFGINAHNPFRDVLPPRTNAEYLHHE